MTLWSWTYVVICAWQLHHYFQLRDRSKNDRTVHERFQICAWQLLLMVIFPARWQKQKWQNDCTYRISKFLHISYYWWQYFQVDDRSWISELSKILNCGWHVHEFSAKEVFFFISFICDKRQNEREPVLLNY